MEVKGKLKQTAKFSSDYELLCAAFSPSGQVVCGGCLDGNLEVYTSGGDHKLLKKCNDNAPDKSYPISCLRFHPKQEQVLVSYSNGMIKLWDVAANACLHAHKENRQAMSNSWSDCGKFYLSTGVDKAVNVYDATSNQLACSLTQQGDKGHEICGDQPRVFTAKFCPGDPNSLISAGWTGGVKFWDLRNPQMPMREIAGPVLAADALDVEASTKLILSGSFRKAKACQVHAWEDGQERCTLGDGMMSQGYSVCWAGPGTAVFGGGYRHLVRVVKMEGNEVLGEVTGVPEVVYSVDFSAAGGNLLSMVTGRDLYLYKLDV